jgi:hypothetical protein
MNNRIEQRRKISYQVFQDQARKEEEEKKNLEQRKRNLLQSSTSRTKNKKEECVWDVLKSSRFIYLFIF